MAGIDVLDSQLPALELILALHRIGAGARHGDTDEHRIAGRACRIGSDRREIPHRARGLNERRRQQCAAGKPGTGLK